MCGCADAASAAPSGAVDTITTPLVAPSVPLSQLVVFDQTETDETSDRGVVRGPVEALEGVTFPPFKFCGTRLVEGCYAITVRLNRLLLDRLEGTLRVDRSAPDGGADSLIVSGDLYRRPRVTFPFNQVALERFARLPIPDPGPRSLADQSAPHVRDDASDLSPAARAVLAKRALVLEEFSFPVRFPRIPIFPRSRYSSYLKVVSVSAPVIVVGKSPCTVTLVAEQFDYTQPPAGSHTGSFPTSPSRTVTIELTETTAEFPWSGPSFTGSWIVDGVVRGTVTLDHVSKFFRRATVEIDTLTGAALPAPVPDGSGGTEFFDSIYAKHGWQLSVTHDQTNVPVPAGVTPTACWSSADLHGLMTANRSASTNLDAEWRIHLMAVPAAIGCGRGVMFDQISVPREGAATFSDDGYPASESSSFGTAAGRKQRDVARAFLRSATHEITHTFNQIHQEQETSRDNSIMSTTPSVANVLGGPTTGAPGVFPDQINLGVNATVRHHLNHFPDPVIRPGGWPFGAWFGGAFTPQATDRFEFDPSEVELAVSVASDAVALGQPVALSWTLTNHSHHTLLLPSSVALEGLFASVSITDDAGTTREFRPYVIRCDDVHLTEVEAGGSVAASHLVFWSSEGFAFARPGAYRVTVAASWSADGVPVGARGSATVFVGYPTTEADNAATALVMHDDVGKWVALGGSAYHLTEAVDRLGRLAAMAPKRRRSTKSDAADAVAAPPPALLAGFAGLLPTK